MISTPRLLLRPWQPNDLNPFAAMNADPHVMRFFPSTLTVEESKAAVERFVLHQNTHGFCFFATEVKATREFMGFIGLQHCRIDTTFTPCIEIGWRLRKKFWGHGYATEGAKACLTWAAGNGIASVYSFTPVVNTPSIRVMQKAGLVHVGLFDHPLVPEDHHLQKHVLYAKQLTSEKPEAD